MRVLVGFDIGDGRGRGRGRQVKLMNSKRTAPEEKNRHSSSVLGGGGGGGGKDGQYQRTVRWRCLSPTSSLTVSRQKYRYRRMNGQNYYMVVEYSVQRRGMINSGRYSSLMRADPLGCEWHGNDGWKKGIPSFTFHAMHDLLISLPLLLVGLIFPTGSTILDPCIVSVHQLSRYHGGLRPRKVI